MRTLGLFAAVCLALQAYSAPMQTFTAIPVPGLGDFTLGMIGPTAMPNANLPKPSPPGGVPAGVPGVPRRRSTHDPVDIRPRQVHSADFAASPNSTLPTAPAAAAAPSRRDLGFNPSVPSTHKRDSGYVYHSSGAHKRAESKKEHHAHMRNEQQNDKKKNEFDISQVETRSLSEPPAQVYDRVAHTANTKDPHARPQDDVKQEQEQPTGPAAYTSGLANGVKSVGAVPHTLSGVANSAPVTAPATPVTSADTSAADAAAAEDAAQEAAAPKPVEEKGPAPADAGAYPHNDNFKYSDAAPADANLQSTPNVRRHSATVDMDPLMPPQNMTGKDPRMGVFNVDSNRDAKDASGKTATKTVSVKDPKVDGTAPAGNPATATAPA